MRGSGGGKREGARERYMDFVTNGRRDTISILSMTVLSFSRLLRRMDAFAGMATLQNDCAHPVHFVYFKRRVVP